MTIETIQDLGEQVPAICEYPDCTAEITRRRVNTCGADPAGGEAGCGLNFCGAHLQGPGQTCERCAAGEPPFDRKTEQPDWTDFKMTGEAWAEWRRNNPERVLELAAQKEEKARQEKEPKLEGTDEPLVDKPKKEDE